MYTTQKVKDIIKYQLFCVVHICSACHSAYTYYTQKLRIFNIHEGLLFQTKYRDKHVTLCKLLPKNGANLTYSTLGFETYLPVIMDLRPSRPIEPHSSIISDSYIYNQRYTKRIQIRDSISVVVDIKTQRRK